MLRSEVRIDHRGSDVGMAQDVLKRPQITACHDEVRGEGMAQDVG